MVDRRLHLAGFGGSRFRAPLTQYDDALVLQERVVPGKNGMMTGFDFFQARYFYGAQGRFNSPDPDLGSMDVTNPQSFNRYAYALNNPLVNTDPTGTDVCADGSYADACVTRL